MFAPLISINRDAVEVVRRPRSTDAVGAALRGAFEMPPLPDDLARLLRRLERAQ